MVQGIDQSMRLIEVKRELQQLMPGLRVHVRPQKENFEVKVFQEFSTTFNINRSVMTPEGCRVLADSMEKGIYGFIHEWVNKRVKSQEADDAGEEERSKEVSGPSGVEHGDTPAPELEGGEGSDGEAGGRAERHSEAADG